YDLDLRHLVDAHHVVAVEIGLLDRAAIDRAFAVERRGEAIDKRASDLALDLGRVDRVTGIGRRDDAVDLEPPFLANRYFSNGRDIAAIAHELGKPLMNPRRRLAVAGLLGGGIEHGQVLRLQHLAAELERVLARGMGQFVDEAFAVDRVLIRVYAAPEAGPEMPAAHRM